MRNVKRSVRIGLAAVLVATGATIGMASPASAGPGGLGKSDVYVDTVKWWPPYPFPSICDRFPWICEDIVVVDDDFPIPPDGCLSCPYEVDLEDVITQPAFEHIQPGLDRQLEDVAAGFGH